MTSLSRVLVVGITMSLLLFGGYHVAAGTDEPPPLPLHGIEGYGGIAITYTAYLPNPAQDGTMFGKPSVGAGAVFSDNSDSLKVGTITETLWDRLELGYGFNAFYLSDLQDDIQGATGI